MKANLKMTRNLTDNERARKRFDVFGAPWPKRHDGLHMPVANVPRTKIVSHWKNKVQAVSIGAIW